MAAGKGRQSTERGGADAPPFSVAFFARDAAIVARELLGAVVTSNVGGRTAGRIVETEAYLGEHDAASHGFRNRRHAQNEALYGPPGSWYVYLSYGMHWCANLVCHEAGRANAVLLRALEPLEGLDRMRIRRRTDDDRLLCKGPGRLCQALGIDRALDGRMVAESPVLVVPGEPVPETDVVAGPRIGITKAVEEPLRFSIRGNRWVSR